MGINNGHDGKAAPFLLHSHSGFRPLHLPSSFPSIRMQGYSYGPVSNLHGFARMWFVLILILFVTLQGCPERLKQLWLVRVLHETNPGVVPRASCRGERRTNTARSRGGVQPASGASRSGSSGATKVRFGGQSSLHRFTGQSRRCSERAGSRATSHGCCRSSLRIALNISPARRGSSSGRRSARYSRFSSCSS